MTTEDQAASWACYPETNGELYYLAMAVSTQFPANCGNNPADGRCTEVPFTTPPGTSALTGDQGAWGGITVQTLVQGAVRTYQFNSNANGGDLPDPTIQETNKVNTTDNYGCAAVPPAVQRIEAES